jgi:hypothetical protein
MEHVFLKRKALVYIATHKISGHQKDGNSIHCKQAENKDS